MRKRTDNGSCDSFNLRNSEITPRSNVTTHSAGPLLHKEGRSIRSEDLTNEHRILSQRIVETEVKIPKKVTREELREKVYAVPVKHHYEEIVEDVVKVRERIVRVSKPIIHEKIIEVPQIEYVEKIIEVPEIIYKEKIKEVPHVEVVERVSRVPKIVYREKIVEIPQTEHRDVEQYEYVEVPEIQEIVVTKEVKVDQYEYVEVLTEKIQIERYLPIPVEAVTFYEFRLPELKPTYNKKSYPIYAPRFIEVPIPTTAIASDQLPEVRATHESVQMLCQGEAPCMCDVEKLAEHIKTRNYDFHFDKTMLEEKFQQRKFL